MAAKPTRDAKTRRRASGHAPDRAASGDETRTPDFYQSVIIRVLHAGGGALTLTEIQKGVAQHLENWADVPVESQLGALMRMKLLRRQDDKKISLTTDGEKVALLVREPAAP